MKALAVFMASASGRILRLALGISFLAAAAFLVDGGIATVIFLVLAGLLVVSSVADVCVVGLITHKTLQGRIIRKEKSINESKAITITLLAISVVASGMIWYEWNSKSVENIQNQSSTQSNEQIATPPSEKDSSSVQQNVTTQTDMLVYLIEEEKLAHDIYTVMYETYGAKVFGNILKSEETHQGRVLELLQTRNIKDPRLSEIGKFSNSELQELYNSLVSKGKVSAEEAYRVGVAIEQKDISDITKQLSTATDSDIVTALQSLRNGSENHLRAFNRQLGRY